MIKHVIHCTLQKRNVSNAPEIVHIIYCSIAKIIRFIESALLNVNFIFIERLLFEKNQKRF